MQTALRPALNSTEEPPVPITDLLLKEYVNELRRRIEIQNILMESVTNQLATLQNPPREGNTRDIT
jgi:hypothetical protein